MNTQDKLQACLLKCYVEVYKELGQDFMSMEKEEDFFLKYAMPEDQQDKIINKVINEARLKPYQRRLVRNSFILGCSPSYTKE